MMTYIPKYQKPKILLIDIKDETEKFLKSEGYNVCSGSFGTPYKIPKGDGFLPMISNGWLPEHSELEIIIINLAIENILDRPQGEKQTSSGTYDWWVGTGFGVIDPRPRIMVSVKDDFNRIYNNGGIFIIFSEYRKMQDVRFGHIENHIFESTNDIDCDNWCFLSKLHRKNLEIISDRGKEIHIVTDTKNYPISKILPKFLNYSSFHCTFKPTWVIEKLWITYALNKYQLPVSGAIVPQEREGWILIFPQIENKPKFISDFLKEVIPDLNPSFFPHIEGGRWIHRLEYELPNIIDMQTEIERINKEAEKQVSVLNAQIKKNQEENEYWYTLLVGSGDKLVQAVIKAFEILDFKKIIDVDEETKKKGNEKELREDIQIHDMKPVLIIDVKGIQGTPDDDESRQAEKHAIMRMREWETTEVQPLTIINHQRHLPPHDRDLKAYRDEIIGNARDTHLGLMTTWDLFKLLRNMENLRWPIECVKPIFYQIGRIEPIPMHYVEIGNIAKCWQKAFGIIPTKEIFEGDHLAIEEKDTFVEIEVNSLQVDDKSVPSAAAGSNCGVGCENASERFREKARVFLIRFPEK